MPSCSAEGLSPFPIPQQPAGGAFPAAWPTAQQQGPGLLPAWGQDGHQFAFPSCTGLCFLSHSRFSGWCSRKNTCLLSKATQSESQPPASADRTGEHSNTADPERSLFGLNDELLVLPDSPVSSPSSWWPASQRTASSEAQLHGQ